MSDEAPRRRLRTLALSMRRHPLTTLVILVVLVAVLVYLVSWMRWRAAHVTTKDARVAGDLIQIASRVPGWLREFPLIEGDHISKEQVLGVLDKRDTQLRLDDLQARIAAATALIQQYEAQQHTTRGSTSAGMADANARVTAARAALARTRHEKELAATDFQRIDKLLKKGVVSRQQWDQSHSTLNQRRDALRHAQAQVQAAEATLDKARAQGGQVDVLTQQINVARQQRKSLVAQAGQVRQELHDRTLKSPIDGVVDKTLVTAGDYVQPGQWLMMIHDPTDIWVEAKIKETAIAQIRVGDPVSVSVDAYPNLNVTGEVYRIGHAATNQFALLPSPNPSGSFTKITQRVPVRIKLKDPDARLKPGLMVEVAIDVSH